MILRAAVLLATLLVAGLLGTGVAAAAPSPTVGAPTAVLTAAAPTATAGTGVPCRTGVRACVRLSTNQAWLLDGKRVVTGPVRISHGRTGFRTPPGSFRVSYKDEDHISSVYDDAPMPYSVFFNGDIAFHQGSVRVTSHGCVHLPVAAARMFFANLRPGDLVQVVR